MAKTQIRFGVIGLGLMGREFGSAVGRCGGVALTKRVAQTWPPGDHKLLGLHQGGLGVLVLDQGPGLQGVAHGGGRVLCREALVQGGPAGCDGGVRQGGDPGLCQGKAQGRRIEHGLAEPDGDDLVAGVLTPLPSRDGVGVLLEGRLEYPMGRGAANEVGPRRPLRPGDPHLRGEQTIVVDAAAM